MVEACFVLGVELDDPGVFVELVEAVLQRVFQRIARLSQPGSFAAFGAQRPELEECSNRLTVFEQHALGFGQEFHPRQQ